MLRTEKVLKAGTTSARLGRVPFASPRAGFKPAPTRVYRVRINENAVDVVGRSDEFIERDVQVMLGHGIRMRAAGCCGSGHVEATYYQT